MFGNKMNYDKLYDTLVGKFLTDLTLTFGDGSNEISIDVHKIFMYIACSYFEKLLTNCKEKNLNNITIQVPNAYIAYDIIMSLYQKETNSGEYPKWYYLLELFICRDFFGLDWILMFIY